MTTSTLFKAGAALALFSFATACGGSDKKPDKTVPTLSVTSPSAGDVLSSATVEVTGLVSDAGKNLDRVDVYVGSRVFLAILDEDAGTFSASASNVPNGTITISAVAFDSRGHAQSSLPFDVFVDSLDPVVEILSPADDTLYGLSDGIVAGDTLSFPVLVAVEDYNGTGTNGNTLTIAACGSQGSGPVSSGSVTIDCTVPSGVSSLVASISDDGGNTGLSAAVTVTADLVRPSGSITAEPLDPSNLDSATFDFSSDETGSTFQCKLDGGAFVPCANSITYTGLSSSPHTFTVIATDLAGNADLSPQTRTWIIDTTGPTTSILTGPSDPTNDTSATFTYSSNEQGSTFECQLDGAPFAACDSTSTTYLSLADGQHTFQVRAVDAAGNADATPDTHVFTVITSTPSTSLTSEPADVTDASTASFTYSSSDAGSTYQCQLDGSAFQSCLASGITYGGLAQGSHTFAVRAINPAGNTDPSPATRTWIVDASQPTILSTNPEEGETNVPLNQIVTATFSQPMDLATINATTFTLTSGAALAPVSGTVTYIGSTASFSPAAHLASNGMFTATLSTDVQSDDGVPLAEEHEWTFFTGSTFGPAGIVNLGKAGTFVILSKSGVSTVPASEITGNVGCSPAAASSLTGFSETLHSTNVYSTSPQVTGKLYAADYAPPTPSNLTTAVGDMELAFTDAAGRAPDVTELGAGDIGGMTLTPGVYKWGSGLLIPSDLFLDGSPTDVWIFQIAQTLTIDNAVQVHLLGGALPKNIFWQVGSQAIIGTTAHVEGVILASTSISLGTDATINGRLLSQTAIVLDSNTVVAPAP